MLCGGFATMDIWVLERGFSVERSLTLDPPKHADQAVPFWMAIGAYSM
jgi:hypothetical protein